MCGLGYVPRGLLLQLTDEEVMCLDVELSGGERTTRVQVNVEFSDNLGREWVASKVVALRLKRALQAPPSTGAATP